MSKKADIDTVVVTLELRTAVPVKKVASKKLWKDALDGFLDAKVVQVTALAARPPGKAKAVDVTTLDAGDEE